MKKLLLTGIAIILLNGCALTDHLVTTGQISTSNTSAEDMIKTVGWTATQIAELAGIIALTVGGVTGGTMAVRKKLKK